MTRDRRNGFTIVEILVIIAIIAVLMGLLMPALGGVRRRAHKMQEIHALKQVAVAWSLYANSNNDYALPGYLDPDVQADWNVRYEFMDRSVIPPDLAATWTWRLMPYLNYNHAMVHGHLDEPEFDMISMTADKIATDSELDDEAQEIAEHPRFGYNGYYVGGWWDEMVEIEDDDVIWRYRFWNTSADPGGGTLGQSVPVVARSPGTIRDPSNLIIFCSAAQARPGKYRKWREETSGWHTVTPPILANEQQWLAGASSASVSASAAVAGGLLLAQSYEEATGLDDRTLEAIRSPSAWVPIGRYTGQVALVYADLHCATELPGAIADQRKWIYSADTKDFAHSP